MAYTIIGLGNPGEEYTNTRHNTGFLVLDTIFGEDDWKMSKPHSALIHKDKVGKTPVLCIKPQTFMNKSGTSIKSPKNLIVIHDDLDLGIGSFKISFNRSAGGHRGVESIIKSVKSEEFIRIRVGISPVTPSGKVKKPSGDAVEKAILGVFKPTELKTLKTLSKDIEEALKLIVDGELYRAMSIYNGR